MKTKDFIRTHTRTFSQPMVAELRDAADLELKLRNIRASFHEISKSLGYVDSAERMPASELKKAIEELIEILDEARNFFMSVSKAPGRQLFKRALSEQSPQAMEKYRRALAHSIIVAESKASCVERLDAMAQWLSDRVLSDLKNKVDGNVSVLSKVRSLKVESTRVESYQRFRSQTSTGPSEVRQFFEAMTSVRDELQQLGRSALGEAIGIIVNREARLAWRQEAEENEAALSLGRSEIERKISQLATLDDEMRECNRQLLVGNQNRDVLGDKRSWDAITRLQGQRALRLREFMNKGVEVGLLELVPVWMMNPDVAARILPMRAGMFDVVVFDESSQLPVEYALHVLYRAKRVIIAGDPKQMPPTAFFQSRVEDEQAELEGGFVDDDADEDERTAIEREENSRDIRDCVDLLELAAVPLPKHLLQIHYRSRYRELIEFSNAAFYKNDLHIPVRHPESLIRTHQPIEVISVNGIYRDQTNPEEAEALVERLAEIWGQSDNAPSIGVITFNRKQADLIDRLIETRAERDSAFRRSLARESGRNDGGEDMAFFVMNVENCQGIERDVILFSSTFGRNDQGTFRRLFGVLGQKGGERRLNVAVTRAREKVIFYTSMPVGEISDFVSVGRKPESARDYLQGYLHYAKLISDGSFAPARRVLDQMVETDSSGAAARKVLPDGFGSVVASYVRNELGFDPISSRDSTVFSVDYALAHPETGRFFIGIECDTPNNKLLWRARDREIWRPKVLKMGIPSLHRVSSVGWYQDRQLEQSLLKQAVSAAFKEAVA